MTKSADEPSSQHENRSRWRVIPATLMTLFGALLLILSMINLLLQLSGFRPFVVNHNAPLRFIAGTVMMTSAAGCCMLAGRLWWRGRWRSAVVWTVITYFVGVSAAMLADVS